MTTEPHALIERAIANLKEAVECVEGEPAHYNTWESPAGMCLTVGDLRALLAITEPRREAVDDDMLHAACKAYTEAKGYYVPYHRGLSSASANRLRAGIRAALEAVLTPTREGMEERFYIDCEFDGHGGPLLSIALVGENGHSIHIEADVAAKDPWVVANVMPLMEQHNAPDCARVPLNDVGRVIRAFIGDCASPVIIADSPVDIGRFCVAISTGADGGWASADYPRMTFKVHNVDCYPTSLPGAVQHNAWWDAMALRAALTPTPPTAAQPEEGAR